MVRFLLMALWLMPCSLVVPVALAQDQQVKPKASAKVEIRWLERSPVKDLTEDKGIRTTCGPELMYPHKSLVLTNTDIIAADFDNHGSVMGIPGDHYLITFHLTEKAKKSLMASIGDEPVKELAIFVDGKYCGTAPFRKSKVATYLPQAGYFKSKPDVERIVATFK